VYRVAAEAPPERIDLTAVGDILSVINARELGGALLIVGRSVPKERSIASWRSAEAEAFAAFVTKTGTSVTHFLRSSVGPDSIVAATLDLARGRFGVETHSPLPTWTGGATFVLPIDSTSAPSGALEPLAPAATEIHGSRVAPSADPRIARPGDPCDTTSSAWDRAEQDKRPSLTVRIDGGSPRYINGGSATIRERMTSAGACLDRFTLIAARIAFQFDAPSRRAVLLSLDDPPPPTPTSPPPKKKAPASAAPAPVMPTARRFELSCSLR
jgi:hypothetical protein